jgi:hypothetical protein
MMNEGKTVSIKYRLRVARVIRSGFEDDDAVVVIPAGTAFELRARLPPPPDAEFVRRSVRPYTEGERASA